MKQQKFNYITCYRKKDGYIYIYLKNGTKYKCKIIKSIVRERYYLDIFIKCNCLLFDIFDIDKHELTSRLPGKYYGGDWPESKTEEEVYVLLRELIKESKKKYALETEL